MTCDEIIARLIELDDKRERHLSAAWLLANEIDLLRGQLRAAGFVPPSAPMTAVNSQTHNAELWEKLGK